MSKVMNQNPIPMNRYLLLQFDGAGLFRKINKNGINYASKDFVFDVDGNRFSRDEIPCFIEPITPYQISNVLHVIFGERPVPSLRKSYYSKNGYYWEMALNSYLKIDTIKTEFGEYPAEKFRTNKSVGNSWVKKVTLTWELINLYVNDNEKYYRYITYLSELLGVEVNKMPYEELIELVRSQPQETTIAVFRYIKNMKDCDGLCYAFGLYEKNGTFALSAIDKSPCVSKPYSNKTNTFITSARVNINGIDDIVRLSGSILAPINDTDIQYLKNHSTGTARILEGGFVWIKGVVNEDNINDNAYIPVKTISVEKSQPYNNHKKETA